MPVKTEGMVLFRVAKRSCGQDPGGIRRVKAFTSKLLLDFEERQVSWLSESRLNSNCLVSCMILVSPGYS